MFSRTEVAASNLKNAVFDYTDPLNEEYVRQVLGQSNL